nr:protein ALP1-like [Tanacetum cinerariifolium]
MLGSIDFMHWEWKNCPVSWQEKYGRGDKKNITIMLEAVASHDLWIWHAFFWVTSANNDIHVLDNSSLFDDLLDDKAPVAPYVRTWIELCETQRRKNKEIRDRDLHLSLQRNLMEHIWQEVEHEDEDF